MGDATSKDIAGAVLAPLPFILLTTVLRFWIRTQRKVLGMDDWTMLATVPVWTVQTIALIGMAWSGVGAADETLSEQQMADALFWFYIFQEFWCFTLVSIKWTLGFTLLRIGGKIAWVEITIWTSLAIVTLCTGGTGMYLFFQCSPVEKNWHTTIDGTCKPRTIQTALSFLVAAVSITTDWIFALLPIFLLWNVQMARLIKLSVVGLLGLGVFASVAPIVRLRYLLGLNDETRFIQNLGLILAWAAAEANVGMLVANLPACRPYLEPWVSRIWSSSTGHGNSKSKGISAAQYAGGAGGVGSAVVPGGNQYVELEEGTGGASGRKCTTGQSRGLETRIYGRDMDDDSFDSLPDHGSQKRIIGGGELVSQIRVQKEFRMDVGNAI